MEQISFKNVFGVIKTADSLTVTCHPMTRKVNIIYKDGDLFIKKTLHQLPESEFQQALNRKPNDWLNQLRVIINLQFNSDTL